MTVETALRRLIMYLSSHTCAESFRQRCRATGNRKPLRPRPWPRGRTACLLNPVSAADAIGMSSEARPTRFTAGWRLKRQRHAAPFCKPRGLYWCARISKIAKRCSRPITVRPAAGIRKTAALSLETGLGRWKAWRVLIAERQPDPGRVLRLVDQDRSQKYLLGRLSFRERQTNGLQRTNSVHAGHVPG